MNLPSRQTGFGLLESLFYLLAGIFVVTCVIKLGPAYVEAYSVKKIISDMVADQTQRGKSAGELKTVITGRFNMSRIDNPKMEDVIIEDKGDFYSIDANYEFRTTFLANVDVVLKFDNLVFEMPKGESPLP
jgi:hypothetical protein